MRLIVVRHGIAIAKRRWDGADARRPLTASGARQARLLGARIGRYRPDEVISSPTLRCRQTVEPVATRAGVAVQDSELLAVDGGARAIQLVRRLVRTRPAGATIVLCTHREVLVEALPALAAEFGVRLGHRPPGAKGSYWSLRFRGKSLVNVKYSHPGG